MAKNLSSSTKEQISPIDFYRRNSWERGNQKVKYGIVFEFDITVYLKIGRICFEIESKKRGEEKR